MVGNAPGWRARLNQLAAERHLRNHRNLPIRFIPQAELPADTAYESHISASGGVPTRDNLHDFFNALVWLTFPRIKTGLNSLQAAELERAGSLPNGQLTRRGMVRDAATIFDENAALFVVREPELLDCLRAHDWRGLFMDRRDAFNHGAEVWLFGHALMEKLVRPYKAITAHTWTLVAGGDFFELPMQEKRNWLDEEVSSQLQDGLSMQAFTPLPVLGVPIWSDNQDELFYTDITVFRPKRQR